MKRKILTWTFTVFACCSFSFSIASGANAQQMDPKIVAAMEAEPPLTQADIDAYVKVWPRLAANQQDKVLAKKLLQEANWTENRAAYVTNKILIAQVYVAGADPNDIQSIYIPSFFKPSMEEIELIKRNIGPIQSMQDKTFGQ